MANVMIELSTVYVGTEKIFDSGYTLEEWEEMGENDRWDVINEKTSEYIGISVTHDDEYLEL